MQVVEKQVIRGGTRVTFRILVHRLETVRRWSSLAETEDCSVKTPVCKGLAYTSVFHVETCADVPVRPLPFQKSGVILLSKLKLEQGIFEQNLHQSESLCTSA